jgi:hypothetical protein
MNYKEIRNKYNKIVYLYLFDKIIWNYKSHILDEKIKQVFIKQLSLYDYYKFYVNKYYDLIIVYNYYNKIL